MAEQTAEQIAQAKADADKAAAATKKSNEWKEGLSQEQLKRIGTLESQNVSLNDEKRDLLHETMQRKEKLRALETDKKAAEDALHIAICATHGVEYLVTWNCRHIANATIRSRIESVCRVAGFEPPIICTPDEMAATDGGDLD